MKGIFLFSNRVSSPPNHSHAPDHRSSSETVTVEDIDFAESVIVKWDLDAHKQEKFSSLFADNREDAVIFLHAVSSLQNAMRVYSKLNSNYEELNRAQRLMQIAIKRLEMEFYTILSAKRTKLDSESVSNRSSLASATSSDSLEDEIFEFGVNPLKIENSKSEKAADVAMEDLRSIADCMIGCGYGNESVKIYKLIRKSIVDEAMHFLGIEKLNHSQMQKMEWNLLDAKIKTWLHGMKTAVKILFHGEKILCDTVFASSEKIAESCFADICKDAAVNMFAFAENFGKSKKILSPEKMFRALDLYQTISDLWPEIETIFWHESLSPVKAEAGAALGKLGEAVKLMLTQLETAIQKDSSKTPPGGEVHPLTRYVMNFLTFLGDYSVSVSEILANWPVNSQTPLPDNYFSSPTEENPSAAAITTRLAWLILILVCKLDGKATLYYDVALSYLFLANNLNYVVFKVKSSNLRLLMGEDWIRQNRSKVTRFLSSYERMGWTKVISSLPHDLTAEIPPHQVKEHFKQFNHSFEEAQKKQASWVIPDDEIRYRVRMSLEKEIVTSYRTFHGKQSGGDGLHSRNDEIVHYAPEDLENYLSELFIPASAGNSSTDSSGRRSSMSSRSH